MDATREPSNFGKFIDEVRRAYQEYLTVPTVIIILFILLGIGMPMLEGSGIAWVEQWRQALKDLSFGEAESTRDILTATAATLITITSITFTVLLLAVQQAASAMSTQIIDQFLRRPVNQVLFGYFVGMSLYSLIILALVSPGFNPILSTGLAFVFSALALYFLAALVYITLTQMRAAIVIHGIHDNTLKERVRQRPFLERTRRTPRISGGTCTPVHSRGDGYVNHIDLEALERALGGRDGLEVVLNVQFGSYVAHGDQVAEIRAMSAIPVEQAQYAVLRALKLGRARDLDYDPAYGVEQVLNIGWTSISSAQHNPSAGSQAIHALRDFLCEWAEEGSARPDSETLPIVYYDDVALKTLGALESLAVAATESSQHQNFALVLRTFAVMFDRLSRPQQDLIEDMVPRLLCLLPKQVLTTSLDEAISMLAAALEGAQRRATAAITQQALERAKSNIPGYLGNTRFN